MLPIIVGTLSACFFMLALSFFVLLERTLTFDIATDSRHYLKGQFNE